MMFEDLYPSKGDYDFNDFVIRYNVHIKDLKQPTTAGENFIKMKFQICAMGGSLPYQPAIRLQGITTGFAKQATLTNEPSPEGLAVQLIDSRADNSDAIFLITGTEALRKKGFCNTYPDKISNDLPTVSFTLAKPFTDKKEHEWKELKKLRNNFDKNFDCFIYNPETKMEIHANIFKPTDMSENTDMEYRSEEGLVWAISVPAAISFPAEKIDIINAFSGFKKWVTSNGKNDTDWYIKPSNSPEFPIITLEAK